MTVLFLISSAGHYGIESMLIALAKALTEQGVRCVLGVFRDARNPHIEVAEEAKRQGLTVEFVSCGGRWDRKAVSRIRELMTQYKVDVVHSQGYKADLYAYASASRQNVALVATSHNWPSRVLSMRIYAALDRLALGRFDGVAAVSEFVAGTLKRWGISSKKLILIPNGVDVQKFNSARPTLRAELPVGSGLTFGFIGRHVPEKGGAELLRAAAKVIAVEPTARFVFAGEGPSRQEWEKLAGELGIQSNVTFAGSRTDMPGVYASVDAVVLPSLNESMPMCLLEAMAAGRPVIATKVGGVPNVVSHENTGLLLEPGDVDGLTQSMIRLIREPELARKLGQNGQSQAVLHFSSEAMAAKYTGFYNEVLASQGRRVQSQGAAELSF